MVNRNKQRGTAFETAVVEFLKEHGHPEAERRALAGALDKGDIIGIRNWCIETKNHKRFALDEWSDEADVEANNAGVVNRVVVFKRPRKNVSEAYCLMPLWQLAELMSE